ncbi:hypothetical protein PGTUg99_008860 [Puccinia graminis f. sp. tritici]|uniref:Uncharacterized protein n=1 Tax=Puccinia graminis f. sp. tritici TaxID=56615 RepID=A0A5B0LJZ0_PUCGR|nr:hypothetical protein PGTUg99_008860 [Puccinia graminis f. sp. tritici]
MNTFSHRFKISTHALVDGLKELDNLSQKTVKLGKLLDGDLKGLDEEKVITFLELDSDYHSKVSKLRKKREIWFEVVDAAHGSLKELLANQGS